MLLNNAQIKVTLNAVGGLTTTTPVTLKSDIASVAAMSSQRLDGLRDVEEVSPTSGSTLVYDSSTDKYIVKQLDLDGGTF